jgi:outer membrane protein assembly factor BamB
MNVTSCCLNRLCPRRWNGRSVVCGLMFSLGALSLSFPSTALDIEMLWGVNPDMIMEGAAVVVDLDGDGNAEILTAAYENIIVLNGAGEELWRFDTKGRYSTVPAILERPGQSPLIFAGDNKGMFTCLDGKGEVVWQKNMGIVFGSNAALIDLNGDGAVELVQGGQSGFLSVLDAETGDVAWESQFDGSCSCPAVGDLDGDGVAEIVLETSAGKLFALNASGKVLWEFDMGEAAPFWGIASPVIFANSTGQVGVAAASHGGRVFCLDGQGRVLWERATRGSVASTLSVGDFDADGDVDLFAVTALGVLYRFDEDGRVLWDIDTQGRSLAAGALIDLDGDGALEYMLCTQQGNLLAFNNAGEIVFNYQFDHRTINVTPTFGDIIKDRPGLEFVITGGESGQIFCFGTQAPVDTSASWWAYRGDNRLTGSWFGLARSDTVRMTPEDLNWDRLFTGDDVTFRVTNPNPGDEALTAEASCALPDGSRRVAVGKVVGQQGLLKIPVSITAPGKYRFEWTLKGAQEEPLVTGTRELTLQPYQNDRALAKRAVIALQGAMGEADAAKTDRGLRGAMHQESLSIQNETLALADLQIAAPGSTSDFAEQLSARTAALNTRAKRALTLADVAPSILENGPNCDVVAFEGATWENRDMDKQLPLEAVTPLLFTRRCVPGEHEPVSVKLFNPTRDTVMIGTRVETQPEGPAVTAHEVKAVPTNLGVTAWDPLVPLQDKKLAIPPLEAREVWLDVDLSGVKAGSHKVEVTFDTGANETKAEIVLDVLPFEMAGFGSMRLCLWAGYNGNAVEDLLAHGNTVFTMGLPGATMGDGENPGVEIDFTALDTFVEPLLGHDVFLLMSGIPALGVPMESEAYVPRLADYLDQVMRHLSAKGMNAENVALYPHDEPGGHGWDTVHHYIAFARQGLKARPSLKFYVNGGGDMAMFEALSEVTSVWCPGITMLIENTPEVQYLRTTGKTMWSYDCGYAYARPIGANTKTINVVGQYRMAAVFVFNAGATGLGFWCYNAGASMWDAVEMEYPIVYTNPDKTNTSSRRWEAVREGMEDTRILIALREKLSDASVSAEAKESIVHLLEGTLSSIASKSIREASLGVARYVIDDSNNDDTVERLRNAMMDCVAALSD